MTDEPVLLEIEGLVKRYEAGPDQPHLSVLEGVDLRVGAGESVAIVGPSGSGKSTLLHVAGGLCPATSGRVAFDGRDLAELDADELAALRNRELGLVFQDHHLLPQCTVLENVLLPTLAGWQPPGRGDAEARARELCARVGLGERLAHRPGRLSGGERQRVAAVRALINGPRLLLADEPTGSLDARTADELVDLMCELGDELGVSLLVVTHAEPVAGRMGRVLELRGGRLHPLPRPS